LELKKRREKAEFIRIRIGYFFSFNESARDIFLINNLKMKEFDTNLNLAAATNN